MDQELDCVATGLRRSRDCLTSPGAPPRPEPGSRQKEAVRIMTKESGQPMAALILFVYGLTLKL